MLQGRLRSAEVSARPQVQAYIKRPQKFVSAQLRSSAASCQAMARSDQPRSDALFRFGVISDVQYADIANGHSHKGTPRYGLCGMHALAGCVPQIKLFCRYYRAALDGLKRAVTGWQQQEVAFAMHLGDIVDGEPLCQQAGLPVWEPQKSLLWSGARIAAACHMQHSVGWQACDGRQQPPKPAPWLKPSVASGEE